MIVNHITHEIFNNIVTDFFFYFFFNALSDCVLQSILKKVQFCLQKAEIKNENVDCEAYKKQDVMKFTPQDTGKFPCSIHYDLLDVQYRHLTYISVVYADRRFASACSGWASL